VAIPFVLISRTLSPSDWVDVTVGPLPEGYENLCLIAEDSKGTGALHWYHAKVVTFTEDPFLNGTLEGGFWDHDNDGFIVASVQWRAAKKYGVLIHRRDGDWRLWWLAPADLQRPSLTRFVFGGGKATMHLPAEDQAQIPSEQILEGLGLIRGESP
jgi:hypothetical protein